MQQSEKQPAPRFLRPDTPAKLAKLGYINQMTLDLTFDMLRTKAPTLALAIRNILSSEHLRLQSHLRDKQTGEPSTFYRVEIHPEDIVKILGELTSLGDSMVKQGQLEDSTERHQFRQLIKDWSLIGDWIIHRTIAETPESYWANLSRKASHTPLLPPDHDTNA